MSAATLCAELQRRGVTLSLVSESGRLSLEGDAADLDARLLAEVTAQKAALLSLLREREAVAPAVPSDALAAFRDAVEAARRPDGLIPVTARVLAAWRSAEAATEMPLTLRGEYRAPYVREVREFQAGAAYDPAAAAAESWRQWEANEVNEAQHDNLLTYAGADVASTRAALRLL